MEIRLLGPLEVVDFEGGLVKVGGKVQRRLLAILAMFANETVSSDSLIEMVWGDDPPGNRRTALQVQISRLRRAADLSLESRSPGYVLRLSPDELDVAVFERLVGEGRRAADAGSHADAVDRFTEALSVWRGEPAELADVPGAEPVVSGWREWYRTAEEARAAAELALGRHAEVVDQLSAMVQAEPFRERRWALLMLALYRCGRQAEALAAFKRLSQMLGEELGIVPGPELSQLEGKILTQDPSLDLDSRRESAPPSGTLTFVVADMPPAASSATGMLRLDLDDGCWLVSTDVGKAVRTAADLAAEGRAVGVHVGTATFEKGRYVGLSTHRVRRLAAAAHPGQALLSGAATALIEEDPPDEVDVVRLGELRLPGTTSSEIVSVVVPAGTVPDLTAPIDSSRAITNLPTQTDTFVGRARELDEIADVVGENRLVTLTGPGGVGKTRLALQVAADQVGRHADGVWFVDLIASTGPVADLVASAIGVPDYRSVEDLEAFTEKRDMLVILDNCEHVIDDAAEVCHRLLKIASNLELLATSRQRLGVPGEVSWTVPTMSAPSPREATPDRLRSADAVALFIERLSARQPDVTVDDSQLDSIADLCRRLDGIPLAIELAAAQGVLMSPADIISYVGASRPLLAGRDRAMPSRQRTLSSVIDWSYQRLSEPEKVVFRRLSVFPASFALDQGVAVCAHDLSDNTVMECLLSLVDHSLLVVVTEGESRRFAMLSTIRDFARHRLSSSGEDTIIEARHAQAFLRLAEEAQAGLQGPESGAWVERLSAEHPNLVEAVSWSARSNGDPDLGRRIVWSTQAYWDMTGCWDECVRLATDLLALDELSEESRGWLLVSSGGLLAFSGELDNALAKASEALGIFERIDDPAGGMRAANILGNVTVDKGDLDVALGYYEQAAELATRAGDATYLGAIRSNQGGVAQLRGDYDTAETLYRKALVVAENQGDLVGQWITLVNLGEVAMERRDLEAAEKLFEESLRRARRCGDRRGQAGALSNSGWAALQGGSPAKARARLVAAVEIFVDIGDTFDALAAMGRLALAAAVLGDPVLAARLSLAEQELRATHGFGESREKEHLDALRSDLSKRLGERFEQLAIDAMGIDLADALKMVRTASEASVV